MSREKKKRCWSTPVSPVPKRGTVSSQGAKATDRFQKQKRNERGEKEEQEKHKTKKEKRKKRGRKNGYVQQCSI